MVFFSIVSNIFGLSLWATPSPAPQDVMPSEFEFGIPSVLGAVRGSYKHLTFGELIFDSGPSVIEETGFEEVRSWVFQAKEGKLTVGGSPYALTCIRVRRINKHTPSLEFFYEFRLSALEGGCVEKQENRLVEMTFVMSDFVVQRYKEGTSHYYGQTGRLMLYPVPLRAPDPIDAAVVDNGFFVGSILPEVPFVAGLRVELMLRPKGEMSCHKSKFNPETDPYSSIAVIPDANGKWGATIPKTGGASCTRLSGGGWTSAVSPIRLP